MKFTKKIGKRRKSRFVTSTSAWASSAIGSLDHGGRIVGVTNGRFSMIDIVRHVLSETGPADLVVATWVVSLESAADLDKNRNRRLEQFDITDDEEIAEFFLGVVERAAKHSTRDQQHARDVLDLVVEPGESMDLEDILEGW